MNRSKKKNYTISDIAEISLAFDRNQNKGSQEDFYLNLLNLNEISFEIVERLRLEYDEDDKVAGTLEQIKNWYDILRGMIEKFNLSLVEKFKNNVVESQITELSISELQAASILNKKIAYLLNNDNTWKTLAEKKYSQEIVGEKVDVMSWKDFVIEANDDSFGIIYILFEPQNKKRPIDIITSEIFETSDVTFHPGDFTNVPSPTNSWKLVLRIFGLKEKDMVRFNIILSEDSIIELKMLENGSSDDGYIGEVVFSKEKKRFIIDKLTGYNVLVGGKKWYNLLYSGSISLEMENKEKQIKIHVG